MKIPRVGEGNLMMNWATNEPETLGIINQMDRMGQEVPLGPKLTCIAFKLLPDFGPRCLRIGPAITNSAIQTSEGCHAKQFEDAEGVGLCFVLRRGLLFFPFCFALSPTAVLELAI